MTKRQATTISTWLMPSTPAERRAIRNTARALCYGLRIPDGDHLVMILGNGDEKTNFDAVQTWVRDQLLMSGQAPGRANLNRLFHALEGELCRWEASLWQ
ncbi:hypothetical protein C8D92_104109 [Tamilnaduibacter salinus]|uniref:Uncharacterized protein n=1 Tax=Tamilnaduibacter salinus TaxID=1484056 RepID=A0A2U1CXD8_9GAMM|nr:hypothetical protein [Tamilnaduibacter salinus]PVY76878.1 hypothetical protein C8D92_104109 [Tamilnaduibacter salinus]